MKLGDLVEVVPLDASEYPHDIVFLFTNKETSETVAQMEPLDCGLVIDYVFDSNNGNQAMILTRFGAGWVYTFYLQLVLQG